MLNIQVFYPWHFSFTRAHYYGGWLFISALLLHFVIKLPTVRSAYRTQGVLRPLRDGLEQTRPQPYEEGGLVSPNPAPATPDQTRPAGNRRRRLAGPAACRTSASPIGGPLRRFALLAPRGRVFGTGPNDFQINKTAAADEGRRPRE